MFPVLFIAHGSPSLVIDPLNPYCGFLSALPSSLPRPKAIVLFTAHWEAGVQQIGGAAAYETIYDFYGFPDEMYRIIYPAKGDPELAAEIAALLEEAGIASAIDDRRGLDHGAWVVLRIMFPQADIPVVALSVDPNLSPAEQYRIGQALAALREKDILMIGSGGTVHNLYRLDRRITQPGDGAVDWAVQFDDWLEKQLSNWDTGSLFAYESLAPHAKMAVPRNEHLIPLFYAMGAADQSRKAELLHRSYQFGSLSLSCWKFD